MTDNSQGSSSDSSGNSARPDGSASPAAAASANPLQFLQDLSPLTVFQDTLRVWSNQSARDARYLTQFPADGFFGHDAYSQTAPVAPIDAVKHYYNSFKFLEDKLAADPTTDLRTLLGGTVEALVKFAFIAYFLNIPLIKEFTKIFLAFTHYGFARESFIKHLDEQGCWPPFNRGFQLQANKILAEPPQGSTPPPIPIDSLLAALTPELNHRVEHSRLLYLLTISLVDDIDRASLLAAFEDLKNTSQTACPPAFSPRINKILSSSAQAAVVHPPSAGPLQPRTLFQSPSSSQSASPFLSANASLQDHDYAQGPRLYPDLSNPLVIPPIDPLLQPSAPSPQDIHPDSQGSPVVAAQGSPTTGSPVHTSINLVVAPSGGDQQQRQESTAAPPQQEVAIPSTSQASNQVASPGTPPPQTDIMNPQQFEELLVKLTDTLKQDAVNVSSLFPKGCFDGLNKKLTNDHWQAFENYVQYQNQHGLLTQIDEIRKMFALTLAPPASSWLQQLPQVANLEALGVAFKRYFSRFGSSEYDHEMHWNKLALNLMTDSWDQWIADFDYLASLAGKTEAEKTLKLISLLPPFLKLNVAQYKGDFKKLRQYVKDNIPVLQELRRETTGVSSSMPLAMAHIPSLTGSSVAGAPLLPPAIPNTVSPPPVSTIDRGILEKILEVLNIIRKQNHGSKRNNDRGNNNNRRGNNRSWQNRDGQRGNQEGNSRNHGDYRQNRGRGRGNYDSRRGGYNSGNRSEEQPQPFKPSFNGHHASFDQEEEFPQDEGSCSDCLNKTHNPISCPVSGPVLRSLLDCSNLE